MTTFQKTIKIIVILDLCLIPFFHGLEKNKFSFCTICFDLTKSDKFAFLKIST